MAGGLATHEALVAADAPAARSRPARLAAGLLAYVARAISGASVRYAAEPVPGGQRIYFANHSSHLDFLVVWSSLPPETRSTTHPVAAADYWRSGRVRSWLATEVFRAVLIDRGGGGREAVARMLAALESGSSLIVFPEGTRGDGAEPAAFKSGLYHLCKARPGVELLPVHLDNLNRILPKGEAIPVPLISRVTFGLPTTLEPGEQKAAFLERARRAVVALQQA